MKSKRFQFEYRKNASKLHRAVGDFLRNWDVVKYHEIYQEYPVNRVNTGYPEPSHHFDWVIPKLHIVIECHGVQHYEPVAFGGNYEDMESKFKAQQRRDEQKKEAALQAGFSYIVIAHHELKLLDKDLFYNKWDVACEEKYKYNKDIEKVMVDVSNDKTFLQEQKKARDKEKRQEYLKSEHHKEKLRKAREYRRERYRRLRDLR